LADTKLSSLTLSYILRNIRQRGPLSSSSLNDSFSELAQDLASIATQWNNFLQPLCTTIPDGTDDADIDAFSNGLSGRSLWADSTATLLVNPTYYDSTNLRPYSVLEALDNLYTYVDDQVAASEQYRTVAKTVAYTILSTESDTVFYNSGLSKPTLTLPSGADGEGLSYLFYVTSSVGLRIAAPTGDTIALGSSTSASAGYIESTTTGSSVRLINIAANQWVAIYYTGTWSVV